jgi:hypothetical protein
MCGREVRGEVRKDVRERLRREESLSHTHR